MEITYHIVVLILAIAVFFMDIEAGPTAIIEFILKIVFKLTSFFLMMYSGIQIAQYFELI